jgi:3-hydroxyisobutyrate dehydrogenase
LQFALADCEITALTGLFQRSFKALRQAPVHVEHGSGDKQGDQHTDQAGVSLDILWDAIKQSVGDSFVARHDAPSIFAGHYDPSFTLGLCLKDLVLCEALAEAGGVPIPIGKTVHQRFQLAAETYGDEAGELHVAKLLEEATGTDLRLDGDFTPHWEA